MEKKLQQLRKKLSDYPHVERIIPEDVNEIDLWEQQGRPYSWVTAEKKNGYEVLEDYGHGWLAVFKNEKLLGVGKDKIALKNVVVLDKRYYGIKKYLWL